jgi:hypothetical protein
MTGSANGSTPLRPVILRWIAGLLLLISIFAVITVGAINWSVVQQRSELLTGDSVLTGSADFLARSDRIMGLVNIMTFASVGLNLISAVLLFRSARKT